MTREEAIAVIDRLQHTESKWPGTEDTLDALDMAKGAIRNEMANVSEIMRIRMLSWEQDSKLRHMRITREQVEKMRGEWDYPECEWNLPKCPKCGCNSKDATYGHKSNFCPRCGAPMTDEAVDMVMERLEALKDGN